VALKSLRLTQLAAALHPVPAEVPGRRRDGHTLCSLPAHELASHDHLRKTCAAESR
jgi:hypothetical protein